MERTEQNLQGKCHSMNVNEVINNNTSISPDETYNSQAKLSDNTVANCMISNDKNMELYLKLHIANHRPG